MTSFSHLRKIAQDALTPTFHGAGFAHARKLTYWRKKEDIYHVVLCDLNRNQNKLLVYVNGWVPEGAGPYDMQRFPEALPMYAFMGLTPQGLEYLPSPLWPVGSEEEARKTLELLAKTVEKIALPWLDQIRSREDLVKWIRKDLTVDLAGRSLADLVLRRSH